MSNLILSKIKSLVAGVGVDFDNAPTINGEGFRAKRNLIVNGAMAIDQESRGPVASGYIIDQWFIIVGTLSAARNTSGSPEGFSGNLLVHRDVTGAVGIGQRIEAANATALEGKQATFSFHHTLVSGNCTSIDVSIYSANAVNDFTGTTLVQTVNIVQSAGMNTVVFNALPASIKNGIQVSITYNVVGDTSVRFTSAQLEEGKVATPFEHLKISEYLAECQRYFVTFGNKTAVSSRWGMGMGPNGVRADININCPVPMRDCPSVINVVITSMILSDTSVGYSVTSLTLNTNLSSNKTVSLAASVAGGLTSFRPYFLEGANTQIDNVFSLSARL